MRSARDGHGESLSFARSSSPVTTTAAASGAAEIDNRPSGPAPGSAPASARRIVAVEKPKGPALLHRQDLLAGGGGPDLREEVKHRRRRTGAKGGGGLAQTSRPRLPLSQRPGGGVVPAKLGEVGIRLERLLARGSSPKQRLDLGVVELTVAIAVPPLDRSPELGRIASRDHDSVADGERGPAVVRRSGPRPSLPACAAARRRRRG